MFGKRKNPTPADTSIKTYEINVFGEFTTQAVVSTPMTAEEAKAHVAQVFENSMREKGVVVTVLEVHAMAITPI